MTTDFVALSRKMLILLFASDRYSHYFYTAWSTNSRYKDFASRIATVTKIVRYWLTSVKCAISSATMSMYTAPLINIHRLPQTRAHRARLSRLCVKHISEASRICLIQWDTLNIIAPNNTCRIFCLYFHCKIVTPEIRITIFISCDFSSAIFHIILHRLLSHFATYQLHKKCLEPL